MQRATWTKKNHKYIRKEGNRYIYPEDLKKISKQHSNRMAAANGKVVNPTYNMKDESGKTIFRLHSNDRVMPTAAQSYAKEQTLQKKQAANRLSNGSNAKNQEYAKQQASAQKRKSALSKQGSSNRYQDAKDFKEYQDWEKADQKKRDSANKRKEALNNQGAGGHGGYVNRRSDHVSVDQAKKESEYQSKYGNHDFRSEYAKKKNVKAVENASNKLKKQGYFTVQNGETKFVPSDEITMKRVGKGKKIVDKIKELFNKNGESKQLKQLKKDRKKGLLSTREYRRYKDNAN